MLDRIKTLLTGTTADSGGRAEDPEEARLRSAAAVLLVEAASLDGELDAQEREAIAQILSERFDLTATEVEELTAAAEHRASETVELYSLTRVLKDSLSPAERIEIVEMLWAVAYADGELHHYEDSLVRRVAGLLYVEDRDRGAARKRVLAQLGIEG